MKTIIRIPFGNKTAAVADREYQLDGTGPVGTLNEFKQFFGNEKHELL